MSGGNNDQRKRVKYKVIRTCYTITESYYLTYEVLKTKNN